ncbi:hypothetical protein DPMN_082945 [Dreissena polymorpha]|uniref:Uncharacterized protein n=1 Tax=Dreissena polymorpha TaxID=45954 RepID=A0A9D4BH88_DREPO|nr:hypothetical protein DPMN_082945 [Dreissena polymorpha]
MLHNVSSSDNVSAAKNWCETTQCPEAKLATKTNCCVWHVNVHSCPKAEITGKNGLCGPWISPSGQTFTHSDVIGTFMFSYLSSFGRYQLRYYVQVPRVLQCTPSTENTLKGTRLYSDVFYIKVYFPYRGYCAVYLTVHGVL